MIDVHQWAEIRRLHFSEKLSIKRIVKLTGPARNTVRAAPRAEGPPVYRRPPRPSKLDPYKGEILRLLDEDEDIPGKRVLEILQDQGYTGGSPS
jgi:transposase